MIEELKDMVDEKNEHTVQPKEIAANESEQTHCADDVWQSESPERLTFGKMFQGWRGKLIMIGGVISPVLLLSFTVVSCVSRLVLLSYNHPVETLIEAIMVVNVPFSIYGAWKAQLKGFSGFTLFQSINLGASIGTALLLVALALCGMFVPPAAGTEMGDILALLLVPASVAAVAGMLLIERVCSGTTFAVSRQRALALTGLGMAIAALLGLASEAKPWLFRVAERKAVSSVFNEQQEGLKSLRSMNPSRELLIECSDARAVGLCGIFMPLSTSSQRQLYFALTGEPFDFRDIHNSNLAAVSDESLARQVVGEQIEGLSLTRSAIVGKLNTDTLTATVDWTFVFKNDTSEGRQAKAVIALPPRAVGTKFTLWSDGKPDDVVFYDASTHTEPIWNLKNHFVGSSNSPCISLNMTDIGNGRVLLDCSPIGAQEEVKVRLTAMVPIKPDTAETATLNLPRLLATNFDLSGQHQIRLRSSLPIKSAMSKLKTSKSFLGDWCVDGKLTASDITHSTLLFTADRPLDPPPVRSLCQSSRIGRPLFIEQSIKSVPAKAPSHLIVVVDGSVAVNKYRKELCKALKRVSSIVDTAVIISSAEGNDDPLKVGKAIETIDKTDFVGGQDNLKSVIRAAELAGETAGSSVLWVHGPQPASNREIYIMNQYESKPSFYDVPLESSTTDTNEFFKNYSEIGPFEMVPAEGAIGVALENLSKKWRPFATDYAVELKAIESAATGSKNIPHSACRDIETLWAHDQCLAALANAKPAEAVKVALEHKFLSPLTPATVAIEVKPITSNQFIEAAKNEAQAVSARPETITWVYQPGTVRVNNLANLEALMNIAANAVELAGIIGGLFLIYQGIVAERGRQAKAVVAGLAALLAGLATPGCINWLLASARDANLFS